MHIPRNYLRRTWQPLLPSYHWENRQASWRPGSQECGPTLPRAKGGARALRLAAGALGSLAARPVSAQPRGTRTPGTQACPAPAGAQRGPCPWPRRAGRHPLACPRSRSPVKGGVCKTCNVPAWGFCRLSQPKRPASASLKSPTTHLLSLLQFWPCQGNPVQTLIINIWRQTFASGASLICSPGGNLYCSPFPLHLFRGSRRKATPPSITQPWVLSSVVDSPYHDCKTVSACARDTDQFSFGEICSLKHLSHPPSWIETSGLGKVAKSKGRVRALGPGWGMSQGGGS